MQDISDKEPPSFPPAPWRLGGSLYTSAWIVPLSCLPGPLPPGCQPLKLAGRVLLLTSWVCYEPGGVLSYNELLAGIITRVAFRPTLTIPQIWVDSPASLAGGRALWGIPKELATFQIRKSRTFEASASSDGRFLASFQFRPRLNLPGWHSFAGATAQLLAGKLLLANMLLTGRIRLGLGRWDPAPNGPLGFLRGRKPLLSFCLANASISFGIPRN